MQLGGDQIDLLDRYQQWLITEAIPAGGIGPNEGERVSRRHIGDSLLFATVLQGEPDHVRDLGSGVGLPGIPLAILLRETMFELVDRSGRRVDLLKRAVRVLGLDNVRIVQREASELAGQTQILVSRATFPPEVVGSMVDSLVFPGGLAVLGGSWQTAPQAEGWDVVRIPAEVLDQTVWLLIMRRQ